MKKYMLAIVLFSITNSVIGQVEKEATLYKKILTNDSLLFNVGFNTCDVRQFENLLSNGFEFFHDKDSICGKKTFLTKIKNGLCQSPETYQSRRELVGETAVFPLYNKNKALYGAIQTGQHNFYEKTGSKTETFAGSAKFTHVWILENEKWKLSKALSYDHQITKKSTHKFPVFNDADEIEKWATENKVPALGIGVIKGGKLQQVSVFGELRKGAAAPYNTMFNVASLTKPVTAIITLKLVSLGQWDLDEPLHKYWTDPDVARDVNSKKLTTRHILNHQTGFSNWRKNNKDGKLHFDFTPGTKSQYSGEGFEYLRKALENKFHKSLNQLGEELIFTPLRMTDTRYFWDAKTDSARVALGYNSAGTAYKTFKNKTANAADDLLTTIEDYGKFLISVMNRDGLTKSVFDEMVKNKEAAAYGRHFGLGFVVYNFGNGEWALSHRGGDKGCQTFFSISPSSKQGLIIFTNADEGYKVYDKLLKHFLGEYGEKIMEIENK